ncbi:unnamed protein product [Porites lobata]|uniref:Reverse transcriptase n=1 Tax=Porites lobata TaxID=104759 RepID=A0ABN8S0W6_9CNID|nr:unnamed protein product [Porites lobata]
MYELYEQLLPTKLYTKEKTQTSTDGEVLCRLCGKVAESVAHVLAGCSSLAQTKYLYRHNAALKILFFELLREHGLMEEVPPWYSPVMPKPAYQNTTSEAFWDIPIYAEHNEVRANRIDARLVNHERKEVCTIEMSCPWIEIRAKKDEEKTLKYGPMMWELKQRYNGYRVEQYNVIIDVLGGYSKHLEKSVRKLLGARARSVLERMQKSLISNTLNIARTFKINTYFILRHNNNNKIEAINSLAVPVVQYSFGIIDWKISELKKIDTKTRKLLNMHKMLHPKADVERLYIPRKDGGRGLIDVETAFKTATIGLDHYLKHKEGQYPE